jgi:hypothetical protein
VELGQPDSLYSDYLYGKPLHPAVPLAWLAPFLSFACGAAASGAWTWTGASLLRLLLGLLLGGPLLGMAWAASTRTEWHQDPDVNVPSAMPPSPLPTLPYTLPGSVGHRLASWLSAVAAWWKHVSPHLRNPLLRLVASTIFSLAVAIQLGQQCLVITAAGLAIAYVSGFGRRRWTLRPVISYSMPLFLTWLLGHAAYHALHPISVLVATSFALTFCPYDAVNHADKELAWQVAPQLAAAVSLVMVKQPVIAAVVTLLATLPLLLAPLLETQSRRGQYFRIVQTQLAVNMVLTALAVGYPS